MRKSTWKGHKDSVTCIDVSRSNPWLVASASDDSSCRLWDARSSRSVRRLGGVFGGEPVNSVCFCAAEGGADEHVVLAAAGEKVFTFDLRGSASIMLNEATREGAHAADEVNMLCCSAPGAVSPEEGGCVGPARALAVDDSGGATVVCGASGELLAQLEGAHENIAMAGVFVGGGHAQALTGGLDASLVLWDLEGGALLHQMQMSLPHPSDPAVIKPEPVGGGGGGGGGGGEDGGGAVEGAAASASSSQLFNPPLVHGLAVAPDGATVAAALGDSSVAILDVCEGEVTQNWRLVATHTAPVAHVHFARFVLARAPTAAGDTLISAGNDGCVVLWNCAHGAEPPVLLRKIAHGAKPNWVATSSVDCCAGGEGGGGGGWGRVYVADTSSDITVYDVPLA